MSYQPQFSISIELLALVEKIVSIRERIESATISLAWIPNLQKDTRIRNGHASTAIEGNPLETILESTLIETILDKLPIFIKSLPNSIWWCLLAYVIIKLLSGAAIKGWFGEWLVCRALSRLDSDIYTTFHDIYLPRPDGKGTTQIDHLVVSKFGIIVIETKNYKGWIFGTERQKQWTQTIYRNKQRFQNPLHQNNLHIKAAASLLTAPPSIFHNLVYFVGGAKLKTKLPDNVMTQGLLSFIRKQTQMLISGDDVKNYIDTLTQHIAGYDKRAIARAHKKQF